MILVEILVLDGASLSSVAITFELLETANRLRGMAGRPPPFAVRLTGSGAQAYAALVPARDDLADRRADLIITPGLALTTEAAIKEGLGRPDAEIARTRLKAAFDAGAAVAASCSGVFLLASAGLLDGRRATTTWWLAPVFARLFPKVELDAEAMLVADARVTTAGAAMAQLDLVLSLIARHADAALADQCARYMLLEQRASQARYMAITFLTGADAQVARAERWARERLDQTFTIDALASAAGLTPRTLARRVVRATGLSPVRLVQRLRVERAVELLETTRLSFEEIARQVGYAEPSTLRRLLRREGAGGARTIRRAL